jgi:protein N-terminal amidase
MTVSHEVCGVGRTSPDENKRQAPASTSQGTTSDYINLINTNNPAITDQRTISSTSFHFTFSDAQCCTFCDYSFAVNPLQTRLLDAIGCAEISTSTDQQTCYTSTMKVATLQLDSKIRNVDHNIATADRILSSTPPPPDLDLLVLPELAFTGYNYPSYESIKPYLEPTTAGVTTKWAISTAKRLHCHVIAGYPELSTDIDDTQQTSNGGTAIEPIHKRYNSTVTVSPTGEILANYRKSFLYYTDESWATEGDRGFFCDTVGSLGKVALGICMDINPYQFEAPWDKYEFATNAVAGGAKLIIMSMAWLTSSPVEEMALSPGEPAVETVSYWLQRFSPLIKASQAGGEDVFVVFSNRAGNEKNEIRELTTKTGQVIPLGESVSYAGSSCVMRFSGGRVSILDMMGKGEEGLLVMDTDDVSPPNSIHSGLRVRTNRYLACEIRAESEAQRER